MRKFIADVVPHMCPTVDDFDKLGSVVEYFLRDPNEYARRLKKLQLENLHTRAKLWIRRYGAQACCTQEEIVGLEKRVRQWKDCQRLEETANVAQQERQDWVEERESFLEQRAAWLDEKQCWLEERRELQSAVAELQEQVHQQRAVQRRQEHQISALESRIQAMADERAQDDLGAALAEMWAEFKGLGMHVAAAQVLQDGLAEFPHHADLLLIAAGEDCGH